MTRYSVEELEKDWEFKIVRSSMPIFRKMNVLQQLVEEEELAGWQLLEKLDDYRLRFKRPVSLRRKDVYLPPGIDPYRTRAGGGNLALIGVMVGLIMLLVMGAAAFILIAGGVF